MPRKAFVLYHSTFHRTAKRIAELLDVPAHNTNTLARPPRGSTLILNWGCKNPTMEFVRINGTWLNPPGAIRLTADKYLLMQQMSINGISVPDHYNHPEPNTVIRDRFSWGGRDLLNKIQINHPFWVKWIEKTREFRIYFAREPDGTIRLALREKEGDKSKSVWNRHNGFTFKNIPEDQATLRSELFAFGKRCIPITNLTFGTVDIIKDHDGTTYLLEVNTAPRLQDGLYPGTMIAETLSKWITNAE